MVKISRNDPCPCGSGKKYKKCCYLKEEPKIEIPSGKVFQLKGKIGEALVQELANKTFLEDWCYLNPLLPNGKELCDLLVVFGEILIIFQVKTLKLNKKGELSENEKQKNIKQLLGAKRQLLDLQTEIELENPRRGKEKFNPNNIKQVHLISILAGENEEYSQFADEVKNDVVHIFNKDFTQIVMSELDTIKDFSDYLIKKELLIKDKEITIMGGEEELLGYYLWNDRDFQKFAGSNVIMIDEGTWKLITNKPEYIKKKDEDKVSYLWDKTIDEAHNSGKKEYEKIAQELARTSRFERRILSKHMIGLLEGAKTVKESSLRRCIPLDGTTYCFLLTDAERKYRQIELQSFCIIARGKFENKKVIGIATEKTIGKGRSFDFCLYVNEKWTEKDKKIANELSEKFGILKNVKFTKYSEDEFPLD